MIRETVSYPIRWKFMKRVILLLVLSIFSRAAWADGWKTEGYELAVTAQGGMALDVFGERYVIESAFSHPHEDGMRYHVLHASAVPDDPTAVQIYAADNMILVWLESEEYRLRREIRRKGERIEICDTLINKTDDVIGIAVRHDFRGAEGQVQHRRIAGRSPSSQRDAGKMVENPTLYLEQKKSHVGLVLEDNAMRLQSGCERESDVSRIRLLNQRLGVKPRESYTCRWSLYPGRGDYFSFVNQVRRDWNVNFTDEGPFDFFSAGSFLTEKDRENMRKTLARKKIKFFALGPWFEYYNGWKYTREEFRQQVTEAMTYIRQMEPEAKCLGMVETNLVPMGLTFFGDTLTDEFLQRSKDTYGASTTPAMTALLEETPWRDSCIRDREGRIVLDCHYINHYDNQAYNMMVYPAPGNHQYEHMREQIEWLLDEVGFDGIYFDQFSLAYSNRADRYTYDRWDGCSVELNEQGRVVQKVGDLGLISALARRELVEIVLQRGKSVVCNSQPVVRELQDLPIFRFTETQGYDPINNVPPGQKRLDVCHLGCPLALGHAWPADWMNEWPNASGSEFFIRTVAAHLHHGLLYYYYCTNFPEEGEHSGEYGPVNHMFPLTPMELHEGWILGKERLISCISGTFAWTGTQKPRILLFDRHGREKPASVSVSGTENNWQIEIKLDNYREIAVIE